MEVNKIKVGHSHVSQIDKNWITVTGSPEGPMKPSLHAVNTKTPNKHVAPIDYCVHKTCVHVTPIESQLNIIKASYVKSSHVKTTVPGLIEMVVTYYNKPGNEVGGNLHIVLDDGNLQDDHIRFCIDQAKTCGDVDGEVLGEALLCASKTQRKRVYKSHYKFHN